jgi:5,10-methylene-tetrahydrofolate dehydrogenase/methenyl tetrahydrofolate cyclohydrolase
LLYTFTDEGTPNLGCLVVGSKAESELYVTVKKKSLQEKLNFNTQTIRFQSNDNDDIVLSQLKRIICNWNEDPAVDSILI